MHYVIRNGQLYIKDSNGRYYDYISGKQVKI